VVRNRETKRKRYVDDRELAAVSSIAVRSIWRWMWLIYRTAQRPEDCLTACPRDIRSLDDGRRALRFVQGKMEGRTGKTVDVIITPEIEEILASSSNVVDLDRPFVCTARGKPYTYDGASAMFRRYVGVCGLKDFGPRDLRAKAATDLYIAGTSLEVIQQLLGHDRSPPPRSTSRRGCPTWCSPTSASCASKRALTVGRKCSDPMQFL
jgi:integrase